MGLLAFGAVGGISHGVTMLEGFKPASWRRPSNSDQGGGLPIRVYIPNLDLLLKPADAAAFLRTNSRVHSQFGCHDTHCCPKGVPDMLQHPFRHFVSQRSGQVQEMSATPATVRVQTYLDNQVRFVSDNVAAAAGFELLSETLRKGLTQKQKRMSRFRLAIANLAEANPIGEPALVPLDRKTREANQGK